ncbi:MAG TPA: class I tRNA ligase family protein, partial [Acidimicrobiales bacterium]|jgi:valyl-tRNA synthetase|nr:class I tRNA ligase family protein [Acidimicrobiales bacterium]
LSVLLRLFAPFLPFVTEECWSWSHEGSIHAESWPASEDLPTDARVDGLLDSASAVLGEIRRTKTDAKVSQRHTADRVSVSGTSEEIALVRLAANDIADAGGVGDLVLNGGDGPLTVDVTLTPIAV